MDEGDNAMPHETMVKEIETSSDGATSNSNNNTKSATTANNDFCGYISCLLLLQETRENASLLRNDVYLSSECDKHNVVSAWNNVE